MFISYRREDGEHADRLYALLRARDVAAWYDQLIAPGSEDWREELVEQLSEARVMVILLSSAALESRELRKELAVADQENVPLLTARLEDVKPRMAFAYELSRGNWFDVFDDPGARLPQLADFLRDLVNSPGQIPQRLEASLQARQDRRRRDSFRRGFLPANVLLVGLVTLVSAAEFALYEQVASPLEQLRAGGVAPLTALMYVLVAVTVASPLLALAVLRGGLSVSELPLLSTAAANTLLLFVLARRFLGWLGGRLRRAPRG